MERRFSSIIHFQKMLLEISEDNIGGIKDEITQSAFVKTKRKLKLLLKCIYIVSEIRPALHHYMIELIKFLSDYIRIFFESDELLSLFNTNFTIILVLLEMKIVTIESIFSKAVQSTHHFLFFQYQLFDFSPEMVKDYWRRCQNNLSHFNIPDFLIYDPENKDANVHFHNQENRDKHHQLCLNGRSDEKIAEIIRNDDIEQFQSLISKNNIKFDVKLKLSIYESIDFINNRNNLPTLIEYAAYFGSEKIFKFLFIQIEKLPPELPYYAIAGGDYETIHLLESRHIAYNSISISTAIEHHRNEIFEYIVSNLSNEEVNQLVTCESCLMPSIINYNLEIFLNYVDSFDLNETNDVDEWNPLLCSAASNHLDILKFLYKKYNVNINAETSFKNDALLIASSKGYLDVVKYLLRTNKFDINKQNQIGETALHIAAKKGYLDIVSYLAKKDGIDLNIKEGILIQFYFFI